MSNVITFGQMKALTYSQKLQYSNAMTIFFRVQDYNKNVLAQHRAGNTSVSYYVFDDNTEQTLFKLGQYILVQNDPVNAKIGLYDSVVKL